jgi:hypothetical protein
LAGTHVSRFANPGRGSQQPRCRHRDAGITTAGDRGERVLRMAPLLESGTLADFHAGCGLQGAQG